MTGPNDPQAPAGPTGARSTSPMGRYGRRRPLGLGLTLTLGLGLLAGCTPDPATPRATSIGPVQLVAFDSCGDALTGLRTAAKASVGPYGFTDGRTFAAGGVEDNAAGPAPQPAKVPGATGGTSASGTPAFSGTNNHEAGVDEPDLVKTDGRRIVTIHNGILSVIDVSSRRVTGSVNLADGSVGGELFRYTPGNLLLAGDHALVLVPGGYQGIGIAVPPEPPVIEPGAGLPGSDKPGSGPAAGSAGSGSAGSGSAAGSSTGSRGSNGAATGVAPSPPATPPDMPIDPPSAPVNPGGPIKPGPIAGPQLVLVDLTGTPRILSRLSVEGTLLDARQVGSTVRVVVRTSPRISFPNLANAADAGRLTANRGAIDSAGIDAWLPRIDVTTGGSTTHPTVGCDAIVRPASFTATNLLTILTVDLGGTALSGVAPLSVVADGDTVYGTGSSLYVATDQRWRAMPVAIDAKGPPRATPGTTIYRFDTSGTGRPRFVAGGTIPGYLLNQYAMSEFNGDLRAATTMGDGAADGTAASAQSAVFVLRPKDGVLSVVGSVSGLGKGERIYAVRYLGPTAYVVTFRQTDPLYTVDLSHPTAPVVRGTLTMAGYSAYLHPAGDGKLIGIGQDADSQGRTQGLQVSLFDVTDPAHPSRLRHLVLPATSSTAEFDPHAFLYWPATGLLVVPVQSYGGGPTPAIAPGVSSSPPATQNTVGVLVLRVVGSDLVQQGFVSNPQDGVPPGYVHSIERSFVIGSTLWTVSDNGVMATDATSLARTAWIPLR